MELIGKVVKVSVSGGTWGIEGDDGQQYMPVNGIPQGFRKQGLRVKIDAQPASGVDLFMWGRQVSISSIHKV